MPVESSRRSLLFGALSTGALSATAPLSGRVRTAGPDSATDQIYPGGYRVAAPPLPAGEPVLISTSLGRLQGIRSGGLDYFRGIPFAEPPVGAARFMPPRPVRAWSGVREANKNPPAAPQIGPVVEAPGTSEDCLYLNIWAPAHSGPHPVYVFIHGGANLSGYSLEHRIDGASFARDGIVCVNIGYRLGAFGFLEFGRLLGQAYRGSANNGLRDILLALQWVGQHIANFGGDPTAITVGGQSAGAENALALTSSPIAKGLFRQIVSQSNGGHSRWTLEEAEAVARSFAEEAAKLGVRSTDLPSAPVDRLIAAQGKANLQGLRGMIDGTLLPGQPYHASRWMNQSSRKLLIGFNRDEAALFGQPDPNKFSPQEKAAFASYREAFPGESVAVQALQFRSVMQFGLSSALFADDFIRSGGQAYFYEWSWVPDTGRFLGKAFHGIEQPFVWDNPRSIAFRDVLPDPAHAPLASRVHQRWVDFIKTGVPSGPQLVPWPEWRPSSRAVLRINAQDQAGVSSIMNTNWYEGFIPV